MDLSMLHQLGKVELHCHLDGSLSLPTIRRLAAMSHQPLPASDAELRQLVEAPPDAATLMDYLRPFDFIRPLLQTKAALRLGAYDVASQAAAENVRYIEVRFAPEFSMDQGLSVVETIQAVASGLQQAYEEFGIVAGVVVCGMRQSGQALNNAMFDEAATLLGHGLVGGDFAGNEAAFPPDTIAASIHHAQQLGIPLTCHAGEAHCAHNIALALALGIHRLGHVTAIADEPGLIDQFVAAAATAELCLTSNLQTKAIASVADYPYAQLRQAGAKLTINTDNRTVSHTTLTNEYALFQQYFGTTAEDFLAFNQNALDAAFLPMAAKRPLYDQLIADYEPFL